LKYDWPGNVRELRNTIERAMILEDTACVRPASLHIAVRAGEVVFAAAAGAGLGPFVEGDLSLHEQERELLTQRTGGNQTQAASLLKISRDAMRYKIKKFNLPTGPTA
jgi:two-component system, NtrC family, response regulator AtoC